jgi:hypothetical protein
LVVEITIVGKDISVTDYLVCSREDNTSKEPIQIINVSCSFGRVI